MSRTRRHSRRRFLAGAASVGVGTLVLPRASAASYQANEKLNVAAIGVGVPGPVVADVSQNFDLYWTSRSAYPAELVLEDAPGGIESLLAHAEQARASALAAQYIDTIRNTPLVQRIEAGTLIMEWGEVSFFSLLVTFVVAGRTVQLQGEQPEGQTAFALGGLQYLIRRATVGAGEVAATGIALLGHKGVLAAGAG